MTLAHTPTAVVAIVCGNAIVGRALELLLRSTRFSVRLLNGSYLDKPGCLDGVQLLLLAPGLDPERREALLKLIDNGPSAARIPVLELVDSARAAQVGDGNFISWPCRAEELKREIKTALLARSESSQDGHKAGRDGQGLQTPQKKRRCPMIKVSVEVNNGGVARFGLSVRAESIGRAVSIAESLYPGSKTRVVFPIEPETFFVEDPAAMAGPVELEMPESVAG